MSWLPKLNQVYKGFISDSWAKYIYYSWVKILLEARISLKEVFKLKLCTNDLNMFKLFSGFSTEQWNILAPIAIFRKDFLLDI